MTTAAHWVGAAVPQIGGSNVSRGYYYGLRAINIAVGERVIIPGQVSTADNNAHAAIMYSDDFDTSGNSDTSTWSLETLFIGGADTPVMTHVAATDDMLVGVVTNLYGADWLNVVYSEDDGASWKIAGVDEADAAIADGGVAFDHADVTARQLLADADEVYSVVRVAYDAVNETAWVSLVRADATTGYGDNCATTATCYLIEVDMTDRATTGCTQTLHGPFFADANRSFDNGIQLLIGTLTHLGIVAIPQAASVSVPGYIDQADGGPTLRAYTIPKDTAGTFSTWTLWKTIALPSNGNSQSYIDSASDNIRHEWGYGHHQVFNGISVVDGSTDVIAACVANQRVTGTKQFNAMTQLGLIDISGETVYVPDSDTRSGQIVVPSNTGIVNGYRGIPCIGVQDWDTNLNVGDGAMSIVAYVNLAGSTAGAPTQFTVGGTSYWGMPLAVFAEMNDQNTATTTVPKSNVPRDGWGLFHTSAYTYFWIWNACPGTDDCDTSTYRVIRMTSLSPADYAGKWCRLCITKAASASGNGDWLCYAGGSSTTTAYSSGTANTIGDVASLAKMRWFHMVNSYGDVISQSSVAGGVWIYNTAFTSTVAGNITKAPGASGAIGPEDDTLKPYLIGRMYSGVGNWKAFGGQRRAGGMKNIEW